MRLYELIDFEPKQSKQTADSYKSKVNNVGGKAIGRGSFATGYELDSPKRKNEITKVGRTGSIGVKNSTAKKVEEDGFLIYMKTIQGQENPYYPTMYDLRVIREPNGALSYRANMHKLSPFFSEKIYLNDDLMTSLYDDMFYGRDYGYFDPTDPGGSLKYTLEDQCIVMPEIIKDPDLKIAIDTIVKISQEHNFMIDLHSGNILWRITGTRPQLILYDPLA